MSYVLTRAGTVHKRIQGMSYEGCNLDAADMRELADDATIEDLRAQGHDFCERCFPPERREAVPAWP